MHNFLKVISAFLVGSVFCESLYYIIQSVHRWKRRSKRLEDADRFLSKKAKQLLALGDLESKTFSQVLFFPDVGIACQFQKNVGEHCGNVACRYSHDDNNSLSRLTEILRSAQTKLDVCVFIVTCRVLGDVIVDCHRRGLGVRLITDREQEFASGSQIGRFRAAGIPVRCNKSPYLMHHKFILLDDELLLNGSFNWTMQAVTGNHENLLITSEPHFVSVYGREFDKLWKLFQ